MFTVNGANYLRTIAFSLILLPSYVFSTDADPLPSWNEGPAKGSILHFIEETTSNGSMHYVDPEDRIVTFDLDGTLLVEKPFSAQAQFFIDLGKSLAKHPFKIASSTIRSIFSMDFKEISRLTETEVCSIIGILYKGMSFDRYRDDVREWLKTGLHPKTSQLYTHLLYRPMIEVIDLLKKNDFKVYIVSGSGQEFIRILAEETGILPPDRIIGTTFRTEYKNKKEIPFLAFTGEISRHNNKGGKVEGINLHIGKKPIASFGNSDGDKEMLEWAQSGEGLRLLCLIRHDDVIREEEYTSHTRSGKLSEETIRIAEERGWMIVSMRNDWNLIYSP